MSDRPTDEELEPDIPVRSAPLQGVPPLVVTDAQVLALASRLATGSGPVAIDTERAHGYRYTGRAYLIQIARADVGIALVDPLPISGGAFAELQAAIADQEWIIHAAAQDLPCLVELGLVPQRLFDTELAARLLGYPRVALGTLTETLLGVRLLKEHSAADWSTRPLPSDWLAYAALDVELLGELRDLLAAELQEQGKSDWAAEEFAHLVTQCTVPVTPRQDPWRRTSGIHGVRSPLGLAVVRELWQERDRICRELDKAPGRVLGDEAIVTLAAGIKRHPVTVTRNDLRAISRFNRREARRYETSWLSAVQRALELPRSGLPPANVPSEGPPQPRSWASRDPEAARRWDLARGRLLALAEEKNLPIENLVGPDPLRRLLWQPRGTDAGSVDAQLAEMGVRPWQRALVVPVLVDALAEAAAAPPPDGDPSKS